VFASEQKKKRGGGRKGTLYWGRIAEGGLKKEQSPKVKNGETRGNLHTSHENGEKRTPKGRFLPSRGGECTLK